MLSGRTGTFTNFYYRDVSADFGIETSQAGRQYLIMSRPGYPEESFRTLGVSKNRMPLNSDVLYVVELTSGKVHAYAFPYNDVRGKQPPVQLQLIDAFPFRQPMQK
jgi:hypothetical protein